MTFIFTVPLSEPVHALLRLELHALLAVLFMTLSLYTWLNRDARSAVLKLLQIRILFQRNTCLIGYTTYFNYFLMLFVRELFSVQGVAHADISPVRFNYWQVRSYFNGYSGSRCFSSIRWCFRLHPFPLINICNRVHIRASQ